jgi:multidrug efflux pump subunit AcrA (membrane-fusion protein)
MKSSRTTAIVVVVAIAAAAGIIALGGKGGKKDPLAGLSRTDRALVMSLDQDAQKTLLASYAAAKASGKEVKIAELMPESVYSVKASPAARKTLTNYLDTSGDVKTATSVAAYADIGGRVVSVEAQIGQKVAKGQLIAQVDPSTPGSSYALSAVRSPISGTVTELAVEVGTKVTTSTSIATVGVLDKLKIEALIRERDVASVRLGQRAVLKFDAYPGESFEASITELSPVLDPTSRTKTAVISLAKPDGRIDPGMYARVRIYTEAHANVVTVPEAAIFERYGESYVYAIVKKEDANRAELRKIGKGIVIDGVAEVKSGVEAGERVVTAGRTALGDGALVHVVSSEGGSK